MVLMPWDKFYKQKTVYVLGGTHASLKLKFATAAKLYAIGLTETIMVLHSDKLTGYDRNLGRNLTNNQWAIKQLIN